ncbi:ATP-grasp domain-containing protein [Halobacillus sp. H74]|uniref:ATP-grasp domain-containing protein n=1 Tax=Halobacillus sp. H74 TaxID=3457436 RepID=UPI003FCDA0D0
MNEDVNILILSCGTRNKIVQYFRREILGKGEVIATDCSPLAPALYEADKHFIVPRIDDDSYLEEIFRICQDNNVKGILSLIDPEISLLAENKHEFINNGITPLISNLDIVDICFDKYKMFKFLVESGFNTAKSYINKEEFYKDINDGNISYPVFVKPLNGSASLNISMVNSKEEIELLFSRFDNLMIQEYMDGEEYGADVYIDMISGETVSIFVKEKLKMRAGETDKAKSVIDKELFDLIKSFVKIAGFKGIIDIDIFKINNKYYISEVNPRFGGGYPHAYEVGINIPEMIIKNVNGTVNESLIGHYKHGIYMMKYNEVLIKE